LQNHYQKCCEAVWHLRPALGVQEVEGMSLNGLLHAASYHFLSIGRCELAIGSTRTPTNNAQAPFVTHADYVAEAVRCSSLLPTAAALGSQLVLGPGVLQCASPDA